MMKLFQSGALLVLLIANIQKINQILIFYIPIRQPGNQKR